MAAVLSQADSKRDGERAIQQTLSELGDDDDLSAALYRANLMTHMAGQLFVLDIEVKRAKLSLQNEPQATFLNLPFDEAVQHFLARGIMTAEEFANLSDLERFRSFTMSKDVSESVIANAKRLLDTALEPDGVGLREFQRQVQDQEVALGFDPSGHGYLENVYRTATSTSYNAGRLRQQTDPDVIATGMLWRYVTALDGRVRDSHAALHGKEWPIGDPEGQRVYPPNGYQCRCNITVIDPEDSDPEQLSRRVSTDDVTQTGFSGPPDRTIQDEAQA